MFLGGKEKKGEKKNRCARFAHLLSLLSLFPLRGLILYILCEVCETHIALATESVVECECTRQVVMSMTASSELEIVAEKWLVVRMCTVLDDEMSTLQRTLTTKVSYTLLCNDYIYIVLRVILMAYEWYDRRNNTILSNRRASED